MSTNNNILANCTVLITGATGFIGGLLVDELITMNSMANTNIKLILPVRDMKKARERYPGSEERYQCIRLIETSLEDLSPEKIDMPVDYIFHCASTTTSSTMANAPAEVADGIILGTRNILDLARRKQVKSMVYLSSMEVYGVMDTKDEFVTEDMLGDVDIYSERSCYPLGKRMAEHYCYLYYKEYGVPVKIARLSQTFGRGIHKDDTRIYAQFARAVMQNQDIVLHTEGLSMGNYCESMDTINALFLIMRQGRNGETYNVVNEENTMRIRDMAALVAEKIASRKINIIIETSPDNMQGYAKDTNLRLSSEKLRKLGWIPTKNLEVMYRDMIDWMNTCDSR